MTHSVYHFFAHLVQNRNKLNRNTKLEDFPFDEEMISCKNNKRSKLWPDLAIRLNNGDDEFTGGELIEAKDSKNLSIPSFNSTIPCGSKEIALIIGGTTSKIRKQMEDAGDNPLSLPKREVYYLVRGNRGKTDGVRVCLVHGSFFETISAPTLVKEAFRQVFDERMTETDTRFHRKTKDKIVNIFDNREAFAETRHINNASVSLRFRPMSQASPKGNILKYNNIRDNSMSFLVPIEDQNSEAEHKWKMRIAFEESGKMTDFNQINIFLINHKLNGPFLAFQISL